MNHKTTLLVSALLTGLLLLGVGGWPVYRHFQQASALRHAKAFAARGDYRNASLSARRALLIKPSNVEACRFLAQLAELSEPSYALEYYQRVVTLEPTVTNKLVLAAQALRYQGPPYSLATQVLDELAPSARGLISFCALKAELALKMGKAADAEEWFRAAARLQPTNELHQLNLSMLGLNSTNPAVASAARDSLQRFRSHRTFSGLALRALIAHSIEKEDAATAEKQSDELLSTPNAVLEDQLQHVEILQKLGSAEAIPSLEIIQASASTNATQISILSSWMRRHGLEQKALAWLTNAPLHLRQDASIRLAAIECFVTLED